MGGEKIRGHRAGAMADAFGQVRLLEQQVMWLTAIEGLAATEAAARLGLDPAELGQIAFHARDRLRVRYAAIVRTRAKRGCHHVADRLPRYALGTVPKDLETGIRFHLAQCPTCADAFEDLNDLAEALRRAQPAPPANLPVPRRPPAVAPPPRPDRVARSAHALAVAVIVVGFAGAAGAAYTAGRGPSQSVAISDGFLAPAPSRSEEIAPAPLARPVAPIASTIPADTTPGDGGGATVQVLGAVVTAPPTTVPPTGEAAVAAQHAPVAEPVPESVPPAAPEGLLPAVVEPVAELAGGVAGLLGGVLSGLLGG